MTIAMTKTVREIAVEQPGAFRIFENLGIDYCCGGGKALQEACLAAGVPTERVVTLLEEARNVLRVRAKPVTGIQRHCLTW